MSFHGHKEWRNSLLRYFAVEDASHVQDVKRNSILWHVSKDRELLETTEEGNGVVLRLGFSRFRQWGKARYVCEGLAVVVECVVGV